MDKKCKYNSLKLIHLIKGRTDANTWMYASLRTFIVLENNIVHAQTIQSNTDNKNYTQFG